MTTPAPTPLRLLVVEDTDDDYMLLLHELRRGGYAVEGKRVHAADALVLALGDPWDLVVTDWMLPGFSGAEALALLAEHAREVPCIVISGTPNEEDAVSALRGGALDFLSKDRPRRFVPAIERALHEARERRARVSAEHELRLSERHALELELQNRRIQEANRLKTEFLANMSHELRTPLNAIIGFAELLYDGQVDPRSPQHKEFLGDILTSGRHLLQLINDVLDLAKVEAGKLDFRPEPVELAAVLGEVAAITRTAAAAKRITLAVEVDPEVARVVIDPNRLKQTAYNYVSNALKFTPDGGRVVIRAIPENRAQFRLEVEDTGVGIAPADVERLFVDFHQLDAGVSKRHQGTGLGLALTRRLVEAQGGTVGVRSTPGHGSVFHAILPRHAVAREAPIGPRAAPVRAGTRRVLVVEDDTVDRDLLVDVLADAGFAVDVARSGREAMTLCHDHGFDAITLDLLLPDTSGLELLAQLRFEPHTKHTPVIVVSVVAERKLVAGFAVHDVLRKPIDRAALLASLERAGVRPDRPGGVLVIDDDDAALRLMEAALAQLGYPAITRSSAAAGLVAARELMPSAVVLDLMMPEMDGMQFLDHFRRMHEHARTPVLIWTSKDLDTTEHMRLRDSAQAIVSKNGNTPSTVVAQLRAILTEPD